MLKSELRKIYLSQQKSLYDSIREEKSKEIAEKFFENFTLENVKTLHVFLAIARNGEVETKYIYEKAWQDFLQIRTVAPRVSGEDLEHIEFTANTKLVENSRSIPEPTGIRTIAEKEIDLVIVPLLSFDKKGNRIGYGKGFYDRFLAKCRSDCLKIGVSYFEPIEEILDLNELDIKLNFCVTPKKFYRFD